MGFVVADATSGAGEVAAGGAAGAEVATAANPGAPLAKAK